MFLEFYTSSYSSSQENCVAVAPVLPAFRKSSYSTSDENCVEVADLPTGAAIRDSKHPDAGHLAFTAREWGAFLTDLRAGEL